MATSKRKEKSTPDVSLMLGKIPPQVRDYEEAVLGGIMIEKRAIDEVLGMLKPESFYVDAHKKIFKAIILLNLKSQPIDILTVTEQLKSVGDLESVGGAYYVTKLTNSVVSGANNEHYSRKITEKYLQRQLIELGSRIISDGFEDETDVFELIDRTEKELFQIANIFTKKHYSGIDSLIVKAFTEIEKARHEPEKLSGITSGFHDLDKKTHGWQATDLIILAARPAVGKTAFALNLARNASNAGTPVGFFSLEMSEGQLIRRLMSCESETGLEKIQRSRFDDEEIKVFYKNAIQPLARMEIFIDDTAGLNIFELRTKARKLVEKEKVGLIIIDYLQLMSGANSNNRNDREREVAEISRGLKKLAKELNIPIIALCQMSRQIENRTSKEPQLSDLRESGAIEQDADAVLFLSRPEYYGVTRDASGETNVGETHLKIAKYRNGSPGSIKLRAQLWIQKFVPFEEVTGLDKTKEKMKKDGVTKSWVPNSQIDETDTTFKS